MIPNQRLPELASLRALISDTDAILARADAMWPAESDDGEPLPVPDALARYREFASQLRARARSAELPHVIDMLRERVD